MSSFLFRPTARLSGLLASGCFEFLEGDIHITVGLSRGQPPSLSSLNRRRQRTYEARNRSVSCPFNTSKSYTRTFRLHNGEAVVTAANVGSDEVFTFHNGV